MSVYGTGIQMAHRKNQKRIRSAREREARKKFFAAKLVEKGQTHLLERYGLTEYAPAVEGQPAADGEPTAVKQSQRDSEEYEKWRQEQAHKYFALMEAARKQEPQPTSCPEPEPITIGQGPL